MPLGSYTEACVGKIIVNTHAFFHCKDSCEQLHKKNVGHVMFSPGAPLLPLPPTYVCCIVTLVCHCTQSSGTM